MASHLGISLVSTALWLAVLIDDLRQRRVAIPVLVALLIVSLVGRPWPWWIISGAMILTSRRWAVGLVPVGLSVSLVLIDLAPGVAIALSAWAWCMKWWAGADAIVLVALTLRFSWGGLLTGLVAMLITAVKVFLKRRQSPARLVLALQEAAHLQPRTETEFPAESELPAAATLAVVGIVLEIVLVVFPVAFR